MLFLYILKSLSMTTPPAGEDSLLDGEDFWSEKIKSASSHFI